MDLSRFHGVVPAMATPFTADERFDEARTRELIEDYIACGVHGISVAGSQGEFFALDEAEHLRLLEIAVETVAGRVPVYAGTGGVTTRAAVRVTKAAKAIGVDLALVITPYFVQPTQPELVEHYTAIAAATDLPVMLYNNPPRTSVNVLPATLARSMREAPTIVGIKDSSGDVTQSVEYKLLTDRRALLFSGRDTIALSLLVHGGEGTISPAANVFPRLMLKLYDAFRRGDLAEAVRISDIFAPLREAWALGSFPVVIKEAMAMAGRDAGPTRAPVRPLAADRRERLREVVERIAPHEKAA
ncbi:4-hydroxy-tetrahydrodipicolinate synthase [Pigmentiphaga soli]|uniref:4-hydroxy-tetrahydrodipicolinate synthase n=1 Tax=Pigmentiphaga soli TaxID=1007095 RepID=A0ABP8HCA2_9BURK